MFNYFWGCLFMEINEHGKIRQAIMDDGYEYNETVSNETGEIVEYFSMCAYSDYSFMYANLKCESKVGEFTVEIDSVFFRAFETLLEGLDELRIDDDFSERYIEFKKNEDGNVAIRVHLLPEEADGVINIKNVMYDLRSYTDRDNTDIKERLSKFFSVISFILQGEKRGENKTLGL